MEAMTRNASNIPTGGTYAGYTLMWICVIFVVYLLCIAVFASGHWIIGLLIVLLTAYAYVRHAMWVGKRSRRGLVRRR